MVENRATISVLAETVARQISAVVSKNRTILSIYQISKVASSGVSIPTVAGNVHAAQDLGGYGRYSCIEKG